VPNRLRCSIPSSLWNSDRSKLTVTKSDLESDSGIPIVPDVAFVCQIVPASVTSGAVKGAVAP
jgi:hypothetical protein